MLYVAINFFSFFWRWIPRGLKTWLSQQLPPSSPFRLSILAKFRTLWRILIFCFVSPLIQNNHSHIISSCMCRPRIRLGAGEQKQLFRHISSMQTGKSNPVMWLSRYLGSVCFLVRLRADISSSVMSTWLLLRLENQADSSPFHQTFASFRINSSNHVSVFNFFFKSSREVLAPNVRC